LAWAALQWGGVAMATIVLAGRACAPAPPWHDGVFRDDSHGLRCLLL